jgi:hypothetical protein
MNANRISSILANTRFRAFTIAVLVLAALAILQVNNLKKNSPMCELLNNCALRNEDMQRIQIALGQAGLTNFRIEENKIMVPVAERGAYLQAVADNNAVPADLREDEEPTPSVNPFLSRSQQLSIERFDKKRQIRDMVIRLPFVDQAWLEMDQSNSRSAFQRSRHTAVVSIRPTAELNLTDQHVDTVKRMIGGAVAGLDPNNIVVIDLSAGFAHQDTDEYNVNQTAHIKRMEIEQKRVYENRIREALEAYPGVEFRVNVEVEPIEEPLVAQTTTPVPTVIVEQEFDVVQASAESDIYQAGANGFASIEDLNSESEPQVRIASLNLEPVKPIASLPGSRRPARTTFQKNVSVSIDVPQALVHELFGPATANREKLGSNSQYKAALAQDARNKFDQLKIELIQKVRPLITEPSQQGQSPVVVTMIRSPEPPAPAWVLWLQKFASENWPSLAVLLIGITLLSLVTRKDPPVTHQSETNGASDQDILAFESNIPPEDINQEVRLSKLIEKDPDAAAKVIESWIRDAG